MDTIVQAKIKYEINKNDIHIIIQNVPVEIVYDDGVEHQLFNMDTAFKLEAIVNQLQMTSACGAHHLLDFAKT